MNQDERHLNSTALIAVGAALLIAVISLFRPLSVNITGNGPGDGSSVGITTTGEGVVHAVPDLAYVNFGVQSTGTSVAAARSGAAAAANRVLDALRAANVADADVRTTSISLYPTYPPYPCPFVIPPVDVSPPDQPTVIPMPMEPSPSTGSDSTGGGTASDSGKGGAALTPAYCNPNLPQAPSGWTYAQSFEVTIRDIDVTGDILDAATAAGVTQIDGIRFDLENRDTLLAQARQDAIKAAKAKAEAMAGAAGTHLGAILSISETSNAPGPIFYGAKDAAGTVSTPVAPGTLDVTVSVTMSFALAQ